MRPSNWLYTIPLRLRSLFRRGAVEQELDEELQFHLEHHIESRMASGATAEEARQSALRAIDGLARRKAECRDMRRLNFLENLAQDLRYAARMLRKSPAFTTVAILSLALGIGSNTAIFSLLNAVLLRPLPVARPEQLALVRPVGGGFIGNFAYPDYQRLRDRNSVFPGMIASERMERTDVGLGGAVRPANGEMVSGNYFQVLEVRPLAGSVFTASDENSPMVVIGYELSRREFGAAPAAVGKTLTINGTACTVVGVTPREFSGEAAGYAAEFWAPIGLQSRISSNHDDLRSTRSVSWLDVMGRLKRGRTLAEADANLKVLVAQIHSELGIQPDRDYLHHVLLEPGGRGLGYLRERFGDPIRVLMAVVVLVVASTNLASLLIARSAARRREMATRLALGASRGRLLRQLLTESLALSAVGGVLGLGLAAWGTRLLLTMVNRDGGSVVLYLRPDARVLAFAALVSVITGMLFGLAPAWRASRSPAAAGLQLGARATGREKRWGLKGGLVIARVALSLALLAAGGLLIGTLRNLKNVDYGFRADHVLR